MAPAREDKGRAFVRETINTVLTNKPPNQAADAASSCPPRGDDQHLVIATAVAALSLRPMARTSTRRAPLSSSGSPAWPLGGSLDDSVRRRRQHTVDKMRPGIGFDLVPGRSEFRPDPANANSGRSSLSANHTTSFFLVSGFGSGAYSAKAIGRDQTAVSRSAKFASAVTTVPDVVTGSRQHVGGACPAHHDHLALAAALRTTGAG